MSARECEPTDEFIAVGRCTPINCEVALGGLPTKFEQPEVLYSNCSEFKNYPRRPSFIGHAVLDGATKGECEHNTPLGPADIYICVHVHVVCERTHMYTCGMLFICCGMARSFSFDAAVAMLFAD